MPTEVPRQQSLSSRTDRSEQEADVFRFCFYSFSARYLFMGFRASTADRIVLCIFGRC